MNRETVIDLVKNVEDLLMSYVAVIDAEDYEKISRSLTNAHEMLNRNELSFLENEDDFLSDIEKDDLLFGQVL